jgi:hypothetical protein
MLRWLSSFTMGVKVLVTPLFFIAALAAAETDAK